MVAPYERAVVRDRRAPATGTLHGYILGHITLHFKHTMPTSGTPSTGTLHGYFHQGLAQHAARLHPRGRLSTSTQRWCPVPSDKTRASAQLDKDLRCEESALLRLCSALLWREGVRADQGAVHRDALDGRGRRRRRARRAELGAAHQDALDGRGRRCRRARRAEQGAAHLDALDGRGRHRLSA